MSWGSLRTAIQFLTVVPLGRSDTPPAERLGRAWFPLVGGLVGAGAGGVLVVGREFLPPAVAAVAALATAALLTGGLHLDGLADAADGLFGGRSRERRLEIMRDPRLGPFGAVALILVLAADIGLLSAMTPTRAFVGLVVTGALSRLALLFVIVFVPYVRTEGLGVAAGGGSRVPDLVVGTALAILPCVLSPARALVAALLAALASVAVVALARRRIGGVTGDVYGACTELAMLAGLVAFAGG